MEELIVSLLASNPATAGVLSAIGILRLVNKPLMSLIRSVVAATKTKSDDEALAEIERSPAYIAVTYVLDWFTSVKIK